MNLSEKYGLDKDYEYEREKLLLDLMISKYKDEEKRASSLDNKSSQLTY